MDRLFVSGRARPVSAALTALVSIYALLVPGVPVWAQQPAPKESVPKAAPAQPKAPQPKAPTAQPKAAPVPAAPAAPQQAVAPGFVPAEQLPALTFTPWAKFCMKPPEAPADAKAVCFTGTDGKVGDGRTFVSAVVIEPEGDTRKILKIMMPLGLQLAPGTRASVDQGQPMTAPYAICFPNGCFADYEATADLVGRMKQGQSLVVQGLAVNNQILSLSVPLAEFAKAHDGPPTDPKVLEERQKKLQEELERRAKELQKGNPPSDKAQ